MKQDEADAKQFRFGKMGRKSAFKPLIHSGETFHK
jgi:hypothetical protein